MSSGIDYERLQWPDLDALDEAKRSGDYQPLADYLLTEYPLHSSTREWLARLLMDELPPRKPGNPKNRKNQNNRLEEWRLFSNITRRVANEGITENQALRDYAEAFEEMHVNEQDYGSFDSVKARYQRAKKRLGIPE